MGAGDVNLIAKIAPLNDAFVGLVDAKHVLGAAGNVLPDAVTTRISKLDSTLSTGLVKITTSTGALSVVTDASANWNTAYGWGDHAGLYSLTSHNHTGTYDPAGTAATAVSGHESTYNHSNYNTAYGWGNHASAGYLTSLAGAVLTDQSTPQTIGLTGARLAKLWATDVEVTNAIAGSITGTAAKATNIVGGNNSTLLGSLPYQSNTDTTTLLAPNTTTTEKFLVMTGSGTNGAAPEWQAIALANISGLITGTAPIAFSTSTGAITHSTSAGYKHVPTSGSTNQILKNSGTSGTASWGTVTESSGALANVTTIGMSGVLTSSLATGTAPFTIASTTAVTNLNADLLDGQHASAFLTSLSGALLATGATTGATSQAQVFTNGVTLSNLNAGRVVTVGTSGFLTDSSGLTFNGATLEVTADVVAQQSVTSASDTYYYYPAFNLRRSRGTVSSPTNAVAGDYTGGVNFYGMRTGGFAGAGSFNCAVEAIVGDYIQGVMNFNICNGTSYGANSQRLSLATLASKFQNDYSEPSLTSLTTALAEFIPSIIGTKLSIGGSGVSPYGLWLQTKHVSVDGQCYVLALNPLGGNVGIGVSDPDSRCAINGDIAIVDGMTAPATKSGYAKIYVDAADGDLKIKFGDGTVKTIVVDT